MRTLGEELCINCGRIVTRRIYDELDGLCPYCHAMMKRGETLGMFKGAKVIEVMEEYHDFLNEGMTSEEAIEKIETKLKNDEYVVLNKKED